MPAVYLATLPDTLVIDAGVFTVGGDLMGVTRGGCKVAFGEEYQNIGFDGKRAPVAGLDRKTAVTATITTRMIQADQKLLALFLEHGGIAGICSLSVAEVCALTVTQAASYSAFADGVPMKLSDIMAKGQYAKDLTVTYQRSDGATEAVNFPKAKVMQKNLAGSDKDAAEWDLVFEARQDLSSSTDTDVVPWEFLIDS